MKKTISLSYDTEKLSVLEQYLAKKNIRLADELDKQIDKLYEKYVPPVVRDYIEARAESETSIRARPSRSHSVQAGDAEN